MVSKSLFEFANIDLLDRAIERVKKFVEKHRPRFIYAFYSGGKDSTVSTLAALRATKNVIVIYTEVVGNTHQLNIELAREFAYEHGMNVYWIEAKNRVRFKHDVETTIQQIVDWNDMPAMIHIRAWGATHGDDFVSALARWGLPRGYVRWCHHEFKGYWWSELPFTYAHHRHIVVGVRASESSHLCLRWLDSEGEQRFDSRNGVDIALSPIYDFSDADIYAILRKHYPRILEHYEEYGDSLNCVFCPLRSIEKQRRIVEKLRDVPWEEFAEALRQWAKNRRNVDEAKLNKIIEVLSMCR